MRYNITYGRGYPLSRYYFVKLFAIFWRYKIFDQFQPIFSVWVFSVRVFGLFLFNPVLTIPNSKSLHEIGIDSLIFCRKTEKNYTQRNERWSKIVEGVQRDKNYLALLYNDLYGTEPSVRAGMSCTRAFYFNLDNLLIRYLRI